MNQFKIIHDRPNCIGCTACASICPKFWTMNDSDGKSDLIGASPAGNGCSELVVSQEDGEYNQDAVEACPVQVIHIQQL